MHTGKYARRTPRRRRHNKKKASLLLTSLILLLTMLIGGTAAFLVASTGSVENAFTPSKVTSDVYETFSAGGSKNNVGVTNTGDTTAYLRAMVIVNWQDAEGNVGPTVPVEGVDYTINWKKSGWIEKDGSYIYSQPVIPGDTTPVLFTDCAPISGRTPAGYGLNVEIICAAIQSSPTSVVSTNWGVAVDGTTITG